MVDKKINIVGSIFKGFLKIHVNELLHFSIKFEDYIGIVSWKVPQLADPYFIEVNTTKGKIMLNYDTLEKWKSILNIFDNINL